MKIEVFGENSVLVSIAGRELRCYEVEFESMSVSDPPTKLMLRDLLSVIEHMGLRRSGDRVFVDCMEAPDGGCVLVFTVKEREHWRFSSADELISAAQAGAVPEHIKKLERGEDGSWTLIPEETPDENAAALLREFCE